MTSHSRLTASVLLITAGVLVAWMLTGSGSLEPSPGVEQQVPLPVLTEPPHHPLMAMDGGTDDGVSGGLARLAEESGGGSLAPEAPNLTVRVSLGGQPIDSIPVRIVGKKTITETSDGHGQVALRVDPGPYEVFAGRHANYRGYLLRDPPEGRSSAPCTVSPDEPCFVDLELYRGASIVVHLLDAEGAGRTTSPPWQLWNWQDSWSRVEKNPIRLDTDSLAWRGLDEGWYALCPQLPGQFEPALFEIERDAEHHHDLIVHERLILSASIRVRRSPGSTDLPIQPRVMYRRGSQEDARLPLIENANYTARWEGDSVVLHLYPGSYQISLTTESTSARPVRSHLLPWKTWTRELVVPSDGSSPTVEWELLYPEVGELLELEGRFHGLQERPVSHFRARLASQGEPQDIRLTPRKDGSFGLLLDTSLPDGGLLTWLQTWGSREEVLGATRLAGFEGQVELQVIQR